MSRQPLHQRSRETKSPQDLVREDLRAANPTASATQLDLVADLVCGSTALMERCRQWHDNAKLPDRDELASVALEFAKLQTVASCGAARRGPWGTLR